VSQRSEVRRCTPRARAAPGAGHGCGSVAAPLPAPQPLPGCTRRQVLSVLALTVAGWAGVPAPARADGVELAALELVRDDAALSLDFAVRLSLPPVVEDALQRGVPVYFVAEAVLLRRRWYWRDERVARVQRQWRIAYQPLTSTWRVGLGGFNQSVATLAEALATISRSSGWMLAESRLIDPGSRYRVEFSYRLDTSQLPGPMQFGLGGAGDWAVGVTRTLALERE
jgi:hypothetical protein